MKKLHRHWNGCRFSLWSLFSSLILEVWRTSHSSSWERCSPPDSALYLVLNLNNNSSFHIWFDILIYFLTGAISSWFNLLSTFLIVRFFPAMLETIGEDGTFFFFSTCTLFSIIFVYFLLPETKGKTLEDMEKLFTVTKEVTPAQVI